MPARFWKPLPPIFPASSIRSPQYAAASASSCSSPARTSRSPRSTARRIAWHHSTHASPARGSVCVRALTARAASVSPSGSSRNGRATAAVRMSDPLPAVRPVRSWSRAAADASSAPVGSLPTAPSTDRVWMPMSGGCDPAHSAKRAATASSPSALRRSTPLAATSRTHHVIDVSSVHSPGSKSPSPPPIIRGPSGPTVAQPNSYPAPSASPAAEPRTAPHARSICAVVSFMLIPPARAVAARGRLGSGRSPRTPRPAPRRGGRARRATTAGPRRARRPARAGRSERASGPG